MYCMYCMYCMYVHMYCMYCMYVLYVLYSSPWGTYPTELLTMQLCFNKPAIWFATPLFYVHMYYTCWCCIMYFSVLLIVRTYKKTVCTVCMFLYATSLGTVCALLSNVGTYVCIAVPLLPNWRTVTCQYYCWHCTSLSLCVTVNLCSRFRVPSAPLAHLVHLVQSAGL